MPLLFALFGIALRGAAFAFRKYAPTLAQARLFGAVFAVPSLITRFFLGAAVGAIAWGRVPLRGRRGVWGAWLHPTSLLGGLMATCTCSFLAGTFLEADAARVGSVPSVDAVRLDGERETHRAPTSAVTTPDRQDTGNLPTALVQSVRAQRNASIWTPRG